VGRLFTGWDEAWSRFLAREDPLEWFFGDFPEDETATMEGWLIHPALPLKEAAAGVQERLVRFDWLVPVPEHFLHVWLGPTVAEGAPRVRAEVGPVTCFHSAVVAEAHGDLHRLVPASPTFLPHLSLAYAREEHDPAELRELLVGLRGDRLGELVPDEILFVRFPASRTTLLRPWEVVRTMKLG
jgi:hypothetical protein